ncbi:hypothetical protein WJF63_25070 [Salmonella enterica subsp. enterica serovar Corvallis]
MVNVAGFSISFCLKLAQHFQVEGVQYLLPPPVWPTLSKEEGQNQLFGVLLSHPGRNAVDHIQQFMP